MGWIPAHRAAGGYRMSLIRVIAFLCMIGYSVCSLAGFLAPKSGSSCNTAPANVCRLTQGEAQADYMAGWPWPTTNTSNQQCGAFSLTGGSWSGMSYTGTYTSGWAPPPPNDQTAFTHSLSTCTFVCPTGQTDNGAGACVAAAPTSCTLAVGTVTRTGYFSIGTDPSGANFAGSPCLSACTNTFFIDSLWSVLVNGVKNYYFKGYFRVVGAGPNGDYCSPDTANAPTPSAGVPAPTCPAGQSVGYVNGVPLCYTPTTPPPPGALPPVTTTTTTATVTNPDNSTTTTNTVNNPDSSQTITTTVTDPNGNKSTTVQQVPPPDKPTADQFCQNNPDAEVCKKKSECEKNPKAVGCAELGDTPAAEDILKRDIPITFNPVSIPENATCPAPINLNIAGHNIPIDYDPICQFAAGIRPVFLAVAYLSAALIMIGGIRENA